MKKAGREVREIHVDLDAHKIAKVSAAQAGVTIGTWTASAIRKFAGTEVVGQTKAGTKVVKMPAPAVPSTPDEIGKAYGPDYGKAAAEIAERSRPAVVKPAPARQMTVDEYLAIEAEKEGA